MNISTIKKELGKYLGKEVIIKYNLGRNKVEKYQVRIKKLYDYVFIVESDNIVKSFSYSDIITKTIRITNIS